MTGGRTQVKIRSMKRPVTLIAVLTLLLASPLNAGCSTVEDTGPDTAGPETSSETERESETTSGPETTVRNTEAKAMSIEQIAEGQRGPARRQVVVADSAGELSEAAGVEVPDAGEGIYISAHAGEQPTGGYQVSISGAERGEVRVKLREPGEGAMVTQALTQPYAVAVVRTSEGEAPEAGDPRFVDASGEPLGWTVNRADATGG